MAINSRAKGKRGELNLAKELRFLGYENARRGQQYCGANGDADVIAIPGIHIECKVVERLNLYDAYEQSERDAKGDEIPTVMHKKNRHRWLVTLSLEDFIEIYKEWEAGLDTAGKSS